MIKLVLLFVLSCGCSAQTNPLFGRFLTYGERVPQSSLCLGYDFGQHYSRIRIFEFDSYSDVKFLKFTIRAPTTLANWSIALSTEGTCTNYFPDVHLYVHRSTCIHSMPCLCHDLAICNMGRIHWRHLIMNPFHKRTSLIGTICLN
jgi:hypothetical protein